MKLEIKEEYSYSTTFKEMRLYYCVYVDDIYRSLFPTIDDAMNYINILKDEAYAPKSKTVYTETIDI